MTKKRLGNSDMELTPIGVGAWAMGGGGWKFGWGPQDDAESVAAIHAALDHGVNWIDTAAVYGLGHSEEVVARALAGRGNRPYVFTKCERVWNDNRRDPRFAQSRLDSPRVRGQPAPPARGHHRPLPDSLARPDPDVEEGWGCLAKLREEGKVRWIGVSNFDAAQMERCRGSRRLRRCSRPTRPFRRRWSRRPCRTVRSTGSARSCIRP